MFKLKKKLSAFKTSVQIVITNCLNITLKFYANLKLNLTGTKKLNCNNLYIYF